MTLLQLHRSLDGPLPPMPPLALAIGNFDGVHLGHQAILAACREAASRLRLQPAAMTFAPLPREYFAKLKNDPALAPARLMSVTEKLAALSRADIRHAFIPRFDQAFAAQSPIEFMSRLKALNVKWLMVGEDFRFGVRRAGDVAMLRAYGAANGFVVETMADIEDISGARVSSTAIRTSLGNGNLEAAQRMLGRPYSIIGRVTHGKKLGRTLGFFNCQCFANRQKARASGRVCGKITTVF